MRPHRRIALLMPRYLDSGRDVIRGVRAYAAQHSNWVLHDGPPDLTVIPYLRDWRPHGIVAFLAIPEFAQHVVQMGVPVIDTAWVLPMPELPVVSLDRNALARMAAEHFVDRGFCHFGFVGSVKAWCCTVCEDNFRGRLMESGYTVSSCYEDYFFPMMTPDGWKSTEKQVRRWLQRLPKPVAIFACNDVTARNLADVCDQMGLQIPHEVGLLGVGNEELECLLCRPFLSSIAIPGEQIGYEAAQLLDKMISGQRFFTASLFLPPIRVVTRQSTDTTVISDPVVDAAIRYILDHAIQPIHVADIVREIGIDRRELERKFRSVLRQSVLQTIRRMRVDLAMKLLAGTNLPMREVARQSGFSGARRLATVFRQVTGTVPISYRRLSQTRKRPS